MRKHTNSFVSKKLSYFVIELLNFSIVLKKYCRNTVIIKKTGIATEIFLYKCLMIVVS